MITFTHNGTTFTCKPEHLADLRIKLEKAEKVANRKPTTPRNPPRKFPNESCNLSSTSEYVKAYLHINNLNYRFDNDDPATGYTLNTASTTWPEGDECTYEEVDD